MTALSGNPARLLQPETVSEVRWVRPHCPSKALPSAPQEEGPDQL